MYSFKICDANKESLLNVKRVLRCFQLSAGLRINFSKSTLIGVGVEENLVHSWGNDLGCSVGTIPFRYLGLPVGANPAFKAVWDPVIVRLRECLVKWKSRFISRAGRIVLIKSVFNSLPLYFLNLFQVPGCVVEEIDRIRRSFFWAKDPIERKLCTIDWNTITKSKQNGGLGVGNIRTRNEALLCKWLWRCGNEKRRTRES